MKKILTYSILTIIITACGFLDEQPQSQLEPDKVITSASSLYENTVLTLYAHIGSANQGEGLQGTYRGVYDLQTFTTNEVFIPTRGNDWYDGGLWQDLYLHTYTAHNEVVLNSWNYLFSIVSLCNNSLYLLEHYKQLLTTEEYVAYNAEVRALRAIYYEYLLDLFARVPIVTEASVTIYDIKQAERSEVFEFVNSELAECLPHLSYEMSQQAGKYYGHITQPVAWFALQKLALNSEIWTDNDWCDNIFPDGNSIIITLPYNEQKTAWEAVEYCASQIESYGFSLDLVVSDCFAVHNETSIENIFTIPMDQNLYRNHYEEQFRSMHYQHGAAIGYGGNNGSCATLETLEIFGYGTANKDARFQEYFFADTVRVDNQNLILSDGSVLVYAADKVKLDLTGNEYVATAGARMYKYAIDPMAMSDGKLRQNDIVLFRYADVLLMKAEAKLRMNKNADNEYNMIRQRSWNEQQTNVTIEDIYEERWRELAWEGWHRQDMIRFHKFTLPYSFRQQLEGEENEYGYTTVFPIPQTIIDMNKNFTQNKGY